ncbi:Nif3-like dinuclear metal center hexameric protein [Geobacillus thermodenitrificans]|jgi:dinuclear metal center YbgI/SA1388 family protein|uniref:Nif3-like dinuclear metal center hexameric protein n=1 Tax=Geobacillus thermodenitrificans TaxID=33940 RepID=UPI002E1AFD17|nr:Nif3-like dinuclear metal center hexameric protein [Geobacillus thermodenitrificans]MED3716119.1 Nif3-like dinuclear metal center hexameric protein [Geobacillus thermodenitrificans]MED4919236.1 Nif3-like dinuclear metal center hexameric protein [Geobacillus thermodenitrificans]
MSRIPYGYEVIQLFEQLAPKSLAMEGDRIGLQIGTLNKPVKKVMVALDVLEDVIAEAIDQQVDLIIAHHPPLYRPLKQLLTDDGHGRMIAACVKHDIAVYAAHTNLDVAAGGLNDWLAEALGLHETTVLVPTYTEALKKLVVYVPTSHAEAVRAAIGDAGAGHIGRYSHCTFNSRGIGTFLPEEGAQPFIGEQGRLEEVEEVRIETIVPASLERQVIEAMLAAHPYEEVAYDIYPLDNEGRRFGLGRIGRLPQPVTLRAFAEQVKTAFSVPAVRVVGRLDDLVQTVAVLGGDGNKFVAAAASAGADVYVTGDVYYHTAHDAQALGLHLVDPGHNVEKVMKQGVARYLTAELTKRQWEAEVIVSNVHTDPFQFV